MHDQRIARWARAASVAMACVFVLAGCSAAAELSGATGARLHLAQVGGRLDDGDRTIPTTRVSTPPLNAYEWTVASVDPSSDRLRLSYTDGACVSADRLAVEETAEAVVIGITASKTFQGNCVAVGISRTATVALRTPLGGRALMEGATGVNDGLPKVSEPTTLPDPTCGSDSVSDVPVGMATARTRMAPTDATEAFVCRTWWPNGSAHTASTTVTDRAAVKALVRRLNTGTTGLHPAPGVRMPCPMRLRGSWYDVYLEGPGLRVEVKADEINCLTITNGAASGRITPALAKALDALFPS